MRVVIPSVQYADFLADTLPAWQEVLPRSARITVVTAPHDRETPRVAQAHGVDVLVTDAWFANEATFNKGFALDLAFGFAPGHKKPPSDGETCLSIDADVCPFGAFPDRATLESDVLYGCTRYHCASRAALEAHTRGETDRADLSVIMVRVRGDDGPKRGTADDARAAARACLGYFQLFRFRPGIRFGHSRTAGKYDIDFRRHFRDRRALTDLYVLHLGELSRANWRGRVVPAWRPSIWQRV